MAPPEASRKPRTWLWIAVLASGVAAAVAVGVGASAFAGDATYATYAGVVGVCLTAGPLEAAYLVARCWGEGREREAFWVAGAASLGSLLAGGAIAARAVAGGAAATGDVAVASGVSLVGLACGLGVFTLFRALGRSTAATVAGVVVVAALAYLASMLWEAAPA